METDRAAMSRETPVHGVDPNASAVENASIVLAARVQDLLNWEAHLKDPARVRELHEMRIAAKRLRYTMEIFAPVVGDPLPGAIERIKVLQELLGDIHDLDVVTPVLARAIRRELRKALQMETWQEADLAGVVGLSTLCHQKRVRRNALYGQLRAEWKRLRKDGILEAVCQAGKPAEAAS